MRTTKDRKYSDQDYVRLARELDDQLGSFRDENSVLKERVRKLKTIHAGLTSQIERGGIVNASSTAGFPKKPRGTSSKLSTAGSRRPSTAGKRVVNHNSSQNNISALSSATGNFSHSGSKEYTPQQMQVIAELRLQMQKNEREVLRLKAEKERVAQMNGGHVVTAEDILRKLKERESELREINMQYETLNIDFTKKERIFNDSKTFIQEVLKQIHEAKL